MSDVEDRERLLPCPFCGDPHGTLSGPIAPSYVECNNCEAMGPEAPSEREAVIAWNKAHAALEATGKAMDALEIQQKECEIEALTKSLSHCQHQAIDYVQAIDSLTKELELAASDKVKDLANAKAVVLAAHNRLSAGNVTPHDLHTDPVVYAVNKLVMQRENEIIKELRNEVAQLKEKLR